MCEMNFAGNLQRWEEQLYILNPELSNESIENQKKVHIRLKKQLQQNKVKVILKKLSPQTIGNGARETYTKNINNDNLIKFEENINTNSSVENEMQLDSNDSFDKTQPLIPKLNRKRIASKFQEDNTTQKQSKYPNSNVSRYSTDCEDNLALEKSEQMSCKSYEFGSYNETHFHEYAYNESLKARRHSRVSSTSSNAFGNRIAGMSLQVKPRSEHSPLTVTLHVPTLQHVFDKEIKFDILMEPPDLMKNLEDTKLTHLINGTDNCLKIKKRRQSNKTGSRQTQNKPKALARKLSAVQQNEDAFSHLLSEVLNEPGEALQSWQAANALCNINNNIIDNYNTNLNDFNAADATAVVVCNRVDSCRIKKYRETKTETYVRIPKARRGRKPKQKQKSDLAKYVEQFADNCAQAGSRTPATSSNISQPLVSSTTQNCDDITTPITYFFESQTGQLVPVSNLSITTTQLIQDEVNTNGPFDEIVNFIDNTNADINSNVIARVLEDGGDSVENINALQNSPLRRTTISSDFPTMTRSAELKTNVKSVQKDYLQSIPMIIDGPQTVHNYFTADDYGVVDLSTASREYNIINIQNDKINDNTKPLDLSNKQLDVSSFTKALKMSDQSLEGEMEANNFKAGLDMPLLLDVQTATMSLEILDDSISRNEKESNISNVADFEYLANNLSDEHMQDATDAATKDTTELLSQFAFSDHSSKTLFETLLTVSKIPNDNDKTDNILNLIECDNDNDTMHNLENSSINLPVTNSSTKIMYDYCQNIDNNSNERVKDESEIICEDMQTGDIFKGILENESMKFQSNEVSIKANYSVKSQEENTKLLIENSKNNNEENNEFWTYIVNINKEENVPKLLSMEKQDPKSPDMERHTSDIDSVQAELFVDLKTCTKEHNRNIDITANKLVKKDEISTFLIEHREMQKDKASLIKLDCILNNCSFNDNNELFKDRNVTLQSSTDNTFINTNESEVDKDKSYDESNTIDLQMEKACETDNDKKGGKTKDKNKMPCPVTTSDLSILELESKLNEDILDFDDDALSLAASSIDSQDESSLLDSSMPEITYTSLEVPPNTDTFDTFAETILDKPQKRFKIPKLRIRRDSLNDASMTVEICDANEDNKILALPVWGEVNLREIFGVTCWTHLVDMCATSAAECCSSHNLRDPEIVRKDLEMLSQMQLNATYRYVHAHLLLYRHYFETYCKIFADRKDRDRLLNSVMDCDLYVECATHLHNTYRSLLQCGFSKVNACRQILSRVRSRAMPFIDVLVDLIMDADWTMFYEHMERFVIEGNYNYSAAQLRAMTVAVLSTKDTRLANVLCTCLTTIKLNEIELVRNAPEIEACLELMKSNIV